MRRILLLAVPAAVFAQDAPRIAKYVPSAPDPTHVFVLDSAHILSAAAIAALQDSARALQTETHADVAWVTLPTLGGRPIEEAALYIGRTWRIGSAGQPGDPLRNRGLVVLYIPDKTKTAGSNFRIEVGNGLEGTITDSRSRTITNAMRESLRAKRYDAAYLAGWSVAARLVREDFAASGATAATTVPRSPIVGVVPPRSISSPLRGVAYAFMLVVIVVALLILALLLTMSRRRAMAGGLVIPPTPNNDNYNTSNSSNDDDDARRRQQASSSWFSSSDTSSSSSDSGSSGGGDFGGGGGFSGGGSSDSI